jgi:hypothetical protein
LNKGSAINVISMGKVSGMLITEPPNKPEETWQKRRTLPEDTTFYEGKET